MATQDAAATGGLVDARRLSGTPDREQAASIICDRFAGQPVFLTEGLHDQLKRVARAPGADWAGIARDLVNLSREAVTAAVAASAECRGPARAGFSVGLGTRRLYLDALVTPRRPGLTYALREEAL